jgi:hypothetical protein
MIAVGSLEESSSLVSKGSNDNAMLKQLCSPRMSNIIKYSGYSIFSTWTKQVCEFVDGQWSILAVGVVMARDVIFQGAAGHYFPHCSSF